MKEGDLIQVGKGKKAHRFLSSDGVDTWTICNMFGWVTATCKLAIFDMPLCLICERLRKKEQGE